MSPTLNIAFLLLSASIVKSLGHQSEEERADPRAEEILQDGGLQDLCSGCKSLVTKVKKKMGDDASKAKIATLVEKYCQTEDELMRAACKKITGEIKDKLCEAVANGGNPKSVCKKVELCKKNLFLPG